MEVIQSQVENCLRYLAENDSHLTGADVLLSSRLAEQSALSAAQVVFGARLARRYQQVLEAAGLTVPSEEAIDAAIEQEKNQAGKLAEQEAQLHSMPKSELSLPEGEEPPKNPNQVYLHQDRSFNEQRIVVEFPYSRAKVQALQPLKNSVDGWAFDRYGKKEWSYPAVAAVQVVESLAEFLDFQIGIGVAELIGQAQYAETFGSELAALEASVLELEREAAMQVAYPYLQGKPLADGHPLYQHQREAVRTLISSQRAVLAHDLGLGKTRSALIAAKSYGLPILVIAPIGLHINWQREAEAADVMLDELISWAKIPEPPETDYTLIADECHLAQSLEAQRTQAFLKLCEQAHAVFPLTGTPMRNAKPINLFPLLVAIRHPLAANRRWYEERYCAGYYRKVGRKNYVFDASGSSHLDELHQLIKDQVLYKKKEECLDLPPKTRIMRTAEVAGATAKTYEKTLDHLRKEHERRMKAKLEERIQELLTELGEEHPERVNREALALELSQDEHNAVALVEMALLRHAGSVAKAESAVELAQEVLDEDGSVVLFTIYRDTADQIAQKLACDVLNGDTPQKERQHMIDQFQVRESRALVCTYGAGGVGITLTAAQTVILVDRPWTPGDTVQAEDRCVAKGQLVMTEQGLRPIESIKVGDRVLTHSGNWREVTATKRREHRGLMTQITYTRYSEPLLCTHDHKIYVKRGNCAPEWIKAHEALPGDFLVMPRPHSSEQQPIVCLPSTARHTGTMINNWGVAQTNGRYKMLAEQFELNDNLLWLFGWYLAEGFSSIASGKGRFISLSAHEDERPILERMQKTFRDMGVNSTIYADEKDKGIELRAFSYELAHWFGEWFGDGCENKRIPPFLLNISKPQALTLLEAYIAGDGYERNQQKEWVSVSQTLASQMALLALQCGYAPTLRLVDNDHHKNCWIGCYTIDGKPDNKALAYWDEQYVYNPIRKVETFFATRRPPTYVYDLTVDDDHSFVVGQAVVHNCHRIGQKGAVTSFWLQFDGLDLRIDALLQQKQERIDQVLLGKRATVGGVPSVRGLATEIMTSVYNDTPVEEFLVQHGLALPDNNELLTEQTLSTPESTTRQRRHRPQNGLRKDGNRDHRVKGSAPRQRIDIKLDPEIIGFLRTLKAENKNTAKEPGYSGFLEELVRQSDAFQHWQQEHQ